MTDARSIRLLVEGIVDETLLRKVIGHFTSFQVATCYGKQGVSYIEKKLAGFSKTAHLQYPLLCLIDLDREECVLNLIHRLLPQGAGEGFLLRVAVREAEAWLLADREGFARFSGVPLNKITSEPDACPDPKQEIIALVSAYGNNKLRDALVPKPGSSARVGARYAPQMETFIINTWDAGKALQLSPSFQRAVLALQRLENATGGIVPDNSSSL